jgi:two-component sensor histidine kinase
MSEAMVADVAQLNENRPTQFELLQESYHRITNQLSLLVGMIRLENQAVGKGPAVMSRESATVLLNDIAARVVSIGQFHRRLVCRPQSAFEDLPTLLVRCCSDLTRSLALSDRVRFRYALGKGCQITSEEAFVIGLLVSEIAMNSIKHAEPRGTPVEISVICRDISNGRPEIEISDNGGGLPKELEEPNNGGVGFQIIRSLARRISAALTVQSDDLGLSFRIVLRERRSDSGQSARTAAELLRRPNVRPIVWPEQRDGGAFRHEMAFHH